MDGTQPHRPAAVADGSRGDARSGTVAFRSAEALLRSNEHAWQAYDASLAAGRADRSAGASGSTAREVMRRLGALHRALDHDD